MTQTDNLSKTHDLKVVSVLRQPHFCNQQFYF